MRRRRPTWPVLRWHLLALRSITGILLLLRVVTRPSVMMRMPLLMLMGGSWPWMTGRRRRSRHTWARNNIGCTAVGCTTSASGLVLVAVLRGLSLSKGSTRRFGTTRRFGPRRGLGLIVHISADDRRLPLFLGRRRGGSTLRRHCICCCRHRRRWRRRSLVVLHGIDTWLGTDRCDGFS